MVGDDADVCVEARRKDVKVGLPSAPVFVVIGVIRFGELVLRQGEGPPAGIRRGRDVACRGAKYDDPGRLGAQRRRLQATRLCRNGNCKFRRRTLWCGYVVRDDVADVGVERRGELVKAHVLIVAFIVVIRCVLSRRHRSKAFRVRRALGVSPRVQLYTQRLQLVG